MPYTATNWVNGVTTLGPTNLNKIERGVAASALVFNVKDETYGAVGDGSTNDTTAIQAAITACGTAGGGTVYLPAGTYKVSSTLTVTDSSVAIVGAGSGSNPGAVAQPPLGPATTIKWAGGANPVLQFSYVQGCRATDFLIDGGTTASHGIYLAGFQYGTLARLGVYNTVAETGISCYITYGSSGSNTCNTQWCSFEDLFLDGATCLYLTGNRPTLTQDVTGNIFRNLCCTYVNTNSAAGVVLDFCDGNSFHLLYIFGKSGTGIALDIKDQARNNFFWHLYAGGNNAANVTRARTPASAGFSNTAFFTAAGGLDSALDPVIDTGAIFNYWTQSNSSVERFVTNTQITAPYLSLRDQVLREGQAIKGEPYPRIVGDNGGSRLTGGTVYLVAIGLVSGDIVTNILANIASAGTGTTLSKVGLYDSSGNRLARSADQGSAWNTVGSYTIALTAPYTVTSTGLYYLAVIATASSTVPALWSTVISGVGDIPFAGGSAPWAVGTSTGLSDLPSSLSFGTTGATGYWMGWS